MQLEKNILINYFYEFVVLSKMISYYKMMFDYLYNRFGQ